ncbi:MAG TPA: glycosyltransferase [Ignavibacteriales bacterium]|nr:glycosyltransferase [Ignavibacteriales bacterium]HPP34396.1 glycosyltransferase [Ignavibacteriales bacterium]
MKKIIFITSRLPFPPIGGDRIKAYNLLRILSKYYNVHLVSLCDKEIPLEFLKFANEINLTYKLIKKRKISYYLNTIKSFFKNNLPLQVNYYYFKDVKKYIDNISNEYDLLYSNLIRTALYFQDIDKPKILDMADSIGLNYIKSFHKTQSIIWKLIYKYEGRRLLEFEKYCVKNFNKSLFFNQDEKNYFNMPAKTEWVPHGVNENLFIYNKIDNKYKNYVVFFGKMDYQPNIDSVLWFVNNVLHRLRKEIKFIVVGAYPTKVIKDLPKKYKNVEITGFIEDPYLILKSSLCIVAPMQTGGGIQNKILECMALGTINIVSSLAAKPIGALHNQHFIINNTPEEFINTIHTLFENPGIYNYLKINSQQYIKDNFTWDKYEKKIISVIETTLSNNNSEVA